MMTKAEGKLFAERWRLVNEVIHEEIRLTPAAIRFRQLACLFGPPAPKHDESIVRARWVRLKSVHHV